MYIVRTPILLLPPCIFYFIRRKMHSVRCEYIISLIQSSLSTLCKFSLASFSSDVCERDASTYPTTWQCGYSWRNTSDIVTWTETVFLSHFMLGRCFLWDASNESGIVFHPLTVFSPTSGSWCYPTTSALVFLSSFSTAPLSTSLSCPHILLLISIHDHATSNYFHALFWIFLPRSLSL